MNIYKHELKMLSGSILTWSISIAAILMIFMALFPTMAADAALLNDVMANMPKELLAAFGMTGMDMASVLGFYGFLFLFCQLCLAIQASNYGFGLVSLEERDMTADFLLAKPVSRFAIMTSKVLAGLTALLITNLTAWVFSYLSIEVFRDGRAYDSGILVTILSGVILFQLFFFTVGLVVSLLMRKVRNVTPLSMALSFGMYVLSAFGGLVGDVKLENITPFKHFESAYVINNGHFNTPLVMISVIVIIISIIGSYILYARRNILSAV